MAGFTTTNCSVACLDRRRSVPSRRTRARQHSGKGCATCISFRFVVRAQNEHHELGPTQKIEEGGGEEKSGRLSGHLLP